MRLITIKKREKHIHNTRQKKLYTLIYTFIRLIHVFSYLHIADTFGFRCLMPDKIQRYSLHFRHWGRSVCTVHIHTKKKKIPKRIVSEDTSLTPDALLVFGYRDNKLRCVEIKRSMLCRQCQLNQQHAARFYFNHFFLRLSFLVFVVSFVRLLSFYGGRTLHGKQFL